MLQNLGTKKLANSGSIKKKSKERRKKTLEGFQKGYIELVTFLKRSDTPLLKKKEKRKKTLGQNSLEFTIIVKRTKE